MTARDDWSEERWHREAVARMIAGTNRRGTPSGGYDGIAPLPTPAFDAA